MINTKEEYENKLFQELSPFELMNLNSQIYYNPEHVDYYMNYHIGNYDWCWKYIKKHRQLLSGDISNKKIKASKKTTKKNKKRR